MVRTPELPLKGAQVGSLIGKLRSHKPTVTKKKKKETRWKAYTWNGKIFAIGNNLNIHKQKDWGMSQDALTE